MARDPWKVDVFRQTHALAITIYRTTGSMPPGERYGLQSQLRRAAVSIPANLAEGSARRSTKEYARFVEVALGSAAELRYLLVLATELGTIAHDSTVECRRLSDYVTRALIRLLTAVERLHDQR
jgi:four helix bundle protein